MHPFGVRGHTHGGHDGAERAENVDFAEGEKVVGGWAAEDVAPVGGFAEAVEEAELVDV